MVSVVKTAVSFLHWSICSLRCCTFHPEFARALSASFCFLCCLFVCSKCTLFPSALSLLFFWYSFFFGILTFLVFFPKMLSWMIYLFSICFLNIETIVLTLWRKKYSVTIFVLIKWFLMGVILGKINMSLLLYKKVCFHCCLSFCY